MALQKRLLYFCLTAYLDLFVSKNKVGDNQQYNKKEILFLFDFKDFNEFANIELFYINVTFLLKEFHNVF